MYYPDQPFLIRTYKKSELAHLYNPNVCLKVALQILRRCVSETDLIIGNAGVNLRGFYLGVSQHFADRFDGNALCKRGCGRKCMAGKVKCQVLFNPANVRYFFQVGVKFLITDYRKYLTVRQLALILLQYHFGNIQQGNIYVRIGLLAFGDYP